MGTIQHRAVLTTVFETEKTEAVWERVVERARELNQDPEAKMMNEDYTSLLVRVPGIVNGYVTYGVLPDGSKLGWETSANAQSLREYFRAAFGAQDWPDEIVEVGWGETGERLVVH